MADDVGEGSTAHHVDQLSAAAQQDDGVAKESDTVPTENVVVGQSGDLHEKDGANSEEKVVEVAEEIDVQGPAAAEGVKTSETQKKCGEFSDELEITSGQGEKPGENVSYSQAPLHGSANINNFKDVTSFIHCPSSTFGHSSHEHHSGAGSHPQHVLNTVTPVSHANPHNFPGPSMFGEMDPLEVMWNEFRNSVVKYVPLEDRLSFLEGLDTLLKANRLLKLQKTFLKPRKHAQPRGGEKRGRGRPRKRALDEETPMELGSQPKRQDLQMTPCLPRQALMATSTSRFPDPPSFVPRRNFVPEIRREMNPFLHPFSQQMLHESAIAQQLQVFNHQLATPEGSERALEARIEHEEPRPEPTNDPQESDGKPIQDQMPILAQMINSNE
uniref:Ovule protein n=2 Tax=Bursaphelenchus xylophilus TaxID=6326 RepID=A0A1I7S572_BURXY